MISIVTFGISFNRDYILRYVGQPCKEMCPAMSSLDEHRCSFRLPTIWVLNSENSCFCLAQNSLTSCFLSEVLETKVNKAVTLPVILYRCETWLVTWKEKKWCWGEYLNQGWSCKRRLEKIRSGLTFWFLRLTKYLCDRIKGGGINDACATAGVANCRHSRMEKLTEGVHVQVVM